MVVHWNPMKDQSKATHTACGVVSGGYFGRTSTKKSNAVSMTGDRHKVTCKRCKKIK